MAPLDIVLTVSLSFDSGHELGKCRFGYLCIFLAFPHAAQHS